LRENEAPFPMDLALFASLWVSLAQNGEIIYRGNFPVYLPELRLERLLRRLGGDVASDEVGIGEKLYLRLSPATCWFDHPQSKRLIDSERVLFFPESIVFSSKVG
jgi:hypothetical protein